MRIKQIFTNIILKFGVGFVLAATIIISLSHLQAYAISDMDDSSAYAKAAIADLNEREIIQGDANGNFYPKSMVTRERLIVLIDRTLNLDISDAPLTPTFTDVPASNWAFPYIEAAFTAGLINGTSKNIFGVGQICTREQLATIITRAYGYKTDDLNNNSQYTAIRSYKDFDQISDWAKAYADKAAELGLVKGVSSDYFFPKSLATMEQAAVIIDRLLSLKDNNNNAEGTIQLTLNGDTINISSPVEKDGTLLVPFDFMGNFSGAHEYNQSEGLLWTSIQVPSDSIPNHYIETWAKIDNNNTYLTDQYSLNEAPFNNPASYEKFKAEYSVSPQIINSIVYVPVDYVAAATSSQYTYDQNTKTLKWVSETETSCPTLKKALDSMVSNPISSVFDYTIKADFSNTLNGDHMNYNFKTTGQYDLSNVVFGGQNNNFHEISDKVKTTKNQNGINTTTLENFDIVKIGSNLYTKNSRTGLYELTDQYAQDKRSDDFTFIYLINSRLQQYFLRYNNFSIYHNVVVDGQSTTKYVVTLSDINQIAYLFGNGSLATVNGQEITYKSDQANPFPISYFCAFFGDHTDRHSENDYVGYPKYTNCSAKLEIYVNENNEIIKEVLSNRGNRDDYSDIRETQKCVYKNIDYSYVYEVEFKPLNGEISIGQ